MIAIQSARSNDAGSYDVLSFGTGVYVGDAVPEEAVGWMADGLRQHKVPNPRIELDSGKVVYGCECWWGAEDATREKYAGCTFIDVDIDEVRAEYRREAAGAEPGEAQPTH